jgi:hypothetical protein
MTIPRWVWVVIVVCVAVFLLNALGLLHIHFGASV